MHYWYKKLNAEMPDREDVLRLTPNPSARELFERLEHLGLDSYADRSDAQQPFCAFGLDGTCCRRCLWGPCRVTKNKKGICGAGPEAVVMANHLRMVASGCAAHGGHARRRLEAILAIADGLMPGEIRGEARARDVARRLGIAETGRSASDVARDVARSMLEDLGRVDRSPVRTLLAFAPKRRIEVWRKLGILPTGAFSEVFEALQRTTLGTDSDWRSLLRHELRVALAFFYACVFAASTASEILYGPARRGRGNVGFGVLGEASHANKVKVAVHGHSPVLAEALLVASRSEEVKQAAREAGADGIQLFGICCTGQEMLARHQIPSVTGILGQELALATGALDALVADQQCVLPAIVPIATKLGTVVVTTSDENRLEGAIHIALDPARVEEVAGEILRVAIHAYATRDHSLVCVPERIESAEVGFSTETILEAFGGATSLLDLLRRGEIRGIVTMVSCNTPRVPFERSNVTIARRLLKLGYLITTTGCAGHALLNEGLAGTKGLELAAPSLRRACEDAGLPPVLPIGGCVDNTRTMLLFAEVAESAGLDLSELPFFYVGAEPGNEKALGMAVAFLAHGVTVLTGYPIPIPVRQMVPVPGGAPDDLTVESHPLADFFAEEVREVLGARIYVEADPENAAGWIDNERTLKRRALGWGAGARPANTG
jgi:anaerobic carbon-monoxide dehydrogenase catalytic subunit